MLFSIFEKNSNSFHKINFIQFLEQNFFNILKIILLVGIFTIILIIILLSLNQDKYFLNKTENIKDIDKSKVENFVDKDFLLENEFIYPKITFFDITTDYKEFMSLKGNNPPDMSNVINEYDVIFKNSIQESLKFNFEKRRGK